ncbi:lipid IV(A) 3-deoxy-D-manno-octulosonic acid transferase [Herbaspirillum lusitanum]|uniref:3-deoxy-D-manno-octulosonic acid transferase n=1 Tax=Herbaspirillum lusitanum TaxID=213312 RepID=A0ABW9A9E8_9BURK
MRLFYSMLWWIALPLVLLRLWRRGRKEPGYRQHIPERIGFYRQLDAIPPQARNKLIWVHAVSVGETRAAEPLINALLQEYPQHHVLLTHMTATGRATGKQLFATHGERVIQSFFPYDTGWMCARFLRYFKPVISILMETEVWPNMVAQCRRQGVTMLLANARLSARSLRRGKHFASLLRPAAEAIDCVAAQSPADAQRLSEFGAREVHVTGSLKFDVMPPASMLELGATWRRQIGARKVLLCASTREGEEELIFAALKNSTQRNWLTVLVPRHPQRFGEVAALAEARGLKVVQRSSMGEATLPLDTDILLGDSMGEMFAYYAACDIAFIGGSLLPLGGQNLIEALALGKPVLIGPHTFNFLMVTEDAIGAGAALRVEDAGDMLTRTNMLLTDFALVSAMSKAAAGFAQQHQGATTRTLQLLSPMLVR